MGSLGSRGRVVRNGERIIDIIREIVIEYYGQMTWVMLEKHIRNRDIDEDDMEGLLETVKEFFGGSEEVITLIFSKYPNIRLDSNEFLL